MIQIPQNHQYTQNNIGDIQPNMFASKNLDLVENYGKVRLGTRMIVNTNSTDNIHVTATPCAFKQWNPLSTSGTPHIFTVAGFYLMNNFADYPAGTADFGVTGGSNSIYASVNSDIEIFQKNLYSSTQTTLEKYALDGGISTVDSSFSALSAHLMCVYTGARLYITDTFSLVTSWDGSSLTRSGANSLELASASAVGTSAGNTITGIKPASNCIWISCINQFGGRGYVYKWDGASTSVTSSYRLDSAGAVALIIKDDVPYVMDVYGRLLKFNGGAFVLVAQLNRRTNQLFYNTLAPTNNRWIHPNGIAVINNRINVLIDTRFYNSTSSIETQIPSGIWEYDEGIGLYHKHSISTTHSGDTITDYGSNRISGAGALVEANYPDNSSSRNGTFVAGASYYTNATATTSAVLYDDSLDTLQKAGYLVSSKIEATDGSVYNLPTVESMWESFFTIYRNLLNSTDKIIPKYRTNESIPSVEGTISWINSTSFTIPNSSVNVGTYYNQTTAPYIAGEVEIMQGVGAGFCAHIKSASLSGGTWTVTLDETIPGATNTSVARFANWQKISEINNLNNNVNYNSDTIGQKSTWIQFKVFCVFSGKNELERFLISNSNGTPAK